MYILLLFILGAAFGSFLNVVALRYDPERFLFSSKVIGGLSFKRSKDRSHCPHCEVELRWFELLPLLSFLLQLGRCRSCRKPISWRYPLVELISGALFIVVPLGLSSAIYLLPTTYYLLSAIWLAAFLILLLMALIDLRHYIIPDEVHVILGLLGVGVIALAGSFSFMADYALLFRPAFMSSPLLNHLSAAAFGGVFFLALLLVTRGRGMGMGDVKLAVALGFLFGWPDILFATIFAFITGSIFGIWKILRKEKDLKSAVPFGPFLALGSLVVFMWGNDILRWYFGLFS